MRRLFFTSDTHFGHKKILEYQPNRALLASTVEEMNEVIISNWNSKVKPCDTVFHLGDVAFLPREPTLEILNRLNGTKIIILGNHDSKSHFPGYDVHTEMFLKTKLSGAFMFLSHKPVYSDVYSGFYHLYGHLHAKPPSQFNLTLNYKFHRDVGVDTTKDLAPIELDELEHY